MSLKLNLIFRIEEYLNNKTVTNFDKIKESLSDLLRQNRRYNNVDMEKLQKYLNENNINLNVNQF